MGLPVVSLLGTTIFTVCFNVLNLDFTERERRKVREKNIDWLPLAWSLLGIARAIWAHALMGNPTYDLCMGVPSTNWATMARDVLVYDFKFYSTLFIKIDHTALVGISFFKFVLFFTSYDLGYFHLLIFFSAYMESFKRDRSFLKIYILMVFLCKVGVFTSALLSCRSAEEADVWCQCFLKKQISLKRVFYFKI